VDDRKVERGWLRFRIVFWTLMTLLVLGIAFFLVIVSLSK